MNKTLIGFIKKELIQTLRDKRMRAVLFVMPLLQMTIFGLALSTEIRGIRLALQAAPSDVMARRVWERAIHTGYFVPADVSGVDPFEWIKSGRAHAALIAPEGGLTRAFHRGDGRLQLLVDATNATRARGVESYLQSIVRQVAADERPAAGPPAPTVLLSTRVLYNPTLESSIFMVPGVMCMILCLITIILTSMSMAREREIGTFELLISAPIRKREILLGKTLPFVLLGMADAVLLLTFAVAVFPWKGRCGRCCWRRSSSSARRWRWARSFPPSPRTSSRR